MNTEQTGSTYDKSVRVHSKIKLAETQLQKTVVEQPR